MPLSARHRTTSCRTKLSFAPELKGCSAQSGQATQTCPPVSHQLRCLRCSEKPATAARDTRGCQRCSREPQESFLGLGFGVSGADLAGASVLRQEVLLGLQHKLHALALELGGPRGRWPLRGGPQGRASRLPWSRHTCRASAEVMASQAGEDGCNSVCHRTSRAREGEARLQVMAASETQLCQLLLA